MMAAMAKDEWVRVAMTDDSVVVELLVRLKKQTRHVAKSAATLRWGIRQPRSRSTRCDAVSMRKIDADSPNSSLRASPTTPLSWSGGGSASSASPSATVDDETSLCHASPVRSKGIAVTNETTSNPTKRLRKKKTFAELKEEEGLLLKERIHLNKKLESLQSTYKIKTARNENLRRIKLDLGLDSGKNSSETQVHNGSASSTFPSHSTVVDLPRSESSEAHEAVPARNSICLLPDLNMMPAEDDSASETLYRIS